MSAAIFFIGASVGSSCTILMLWLIDRSARHTDREIEATLNRSRLAHWEKPNDKDAQ